MSKSLNNSPDPIDVIETYGADALRFTMIYIAPTGQDIFYSNEKCEIGRNFANKIWNAARFRQRQGPVTERWADVSDLTREQLRPDDRWILARLSQTVEQVTDALENFRFHELSRLLYEFTWNEFCDWYLESAKAVLNGEDEDARRTVLRLFDHVLGTVLRLLHPVMPFVTEEVYHELGFAAADASIMLAPWPSPLSADVAARFGADAELVARCEAKFELIRGVRNVKASYNVPPNQRIPVVLVPGSEAEEAFLREDEVSLRSLLTASELEICGSYDPEGPAGTAVTSLGTAYVPLAHIIDLDEERGRLRKQEEELLGYKRTSEKKLANENFVEKAPDEVVQRERDRLADVEDKLARLREQIEALS